MRKIFLISIVACVALLLPAQTNTNIFTDQFGNTVTMTWYGGGTNCAVQVKIQTRAINPLSDPPTNLTLTIITQ